MSTESPAGASTGLTQLGGLTGLAEQSPGARARLFQGGLGHDFSSLVKSKRSVYGANRSPLNACHAGGGARHSSGGPEGVSNQASQRLRSSRVVKKNERWPLGLSCVISDALTSSIGDTGSAGVMLSKRTR